MVAGFIASLKVAVTTVLGQTPTEPLGGVTEITVGGATGVGTGCEGPHEITCQRIAKHVLGTGGNRGGIDGIQCQALDGVKVTIVLLDAS